MKFRVFIVLLFCGCNAHSEQVPNTSDFDAPAPDSFLQTGWYYITDTSTGYSRVLERDTMHYFLFASPIVTSKDIVMTEVFEYKSGGYGLATYFSKGSTNKWSEATELAIGKFIAFVLDNRLICVTKVNGRIDGGVSAINGNTYSKEDLQKIEKALSIHK